MAKIKVTCDSTCDLTPELYEKYDIEVIPLGVTVGDELHYDGVDVTPADLYKYADEHNVLPKTSAIPVYTYQEIFNKYVSQGYSVIHINISAEMSACHQNACIAAEAVGGVFPIDSRNLSSGSGHLAIEAAIMAQNGLEATEIADKLNEMKTRLDVSFIIQTLEYLKMGGRCSSVAAFGANLLKLRPEIVVREGTMSVGRKYRGTMDKTIEDYIRGRLEGRTDLQLGRIFVTHSEMSAESVNRAIALVKELQPFEEVIETTAGCTVSSHCGPDCIGVLFFTN